MKKKNKKHIQPQKIDDRISNKHFIPLVIIVLIIILIGVYMMLTNQTDVGYSRPRFIPWSKGTYYILDGTGVIGIGVFCLIVLLIYRFKASRK